MRKRLYEGINVDGETVGLITYMRTDGVSMAEEAIKRLPATISVGNMARNTYLPPLAFIRVRQKNAQEAHEAVRPTDITKRPRDLTVLEDDQRKLYELIWNRAVASQMGSAVLDQVAIDLRPTGASVSDDTVTLRATGSVIAFDGYLRLYQEGKDDSDDDDKEKILPAVAEGEPLNRETVNA